MKSSSGARTRTPLQPPPTTAKTLACHGHPEDDSHAHLPVRMDVRRLWSTIGRSFSSPVAPRERASATRHSSLRVSARYGSAPKLRGTTPRATDSVASRCDRPARSTSQRHLAPSTRLAHSGVPAACRILTSCVLCHRRSRHLVR